MGTKNPQKLDIKTKNHKVERKCWVKSYETDGTIGNDFYKTNIKSLSSAGFLESTSSTLILIIIWSPPSISESTPY